MSNTKWPARSRWLPAAWVLSAGLAMAGSLARADDAPRLGPPGPERMVEHMTQELSLTDAQQKQVAEILKASMEKHRALMEEQDKQINAVLTAEQQAKFKKMQEEHRQHMREGWHGGMHHHEHGGMGAPPPPDATAPPAPAN